MVRVFKMKKEELRIALIEEYLSHWCIRWQWNEDGSIDAEGSVVIASNISSNITLPIKFRKIEGSFYCDPILNSLDNFPSEIDGIFYYFAYNQDKNITAEDIRKICKVNGKIY